MSHNYSANSYRGTSEQVARLKFAPNPVLNERIRAFYNQNTLAGMGNNALLLHSLKTVTCQKSTAEYGYERNMTATRNYQEVNAAQIKLALRKNAPLSVSDTGEYKKLKHDAGLDLRLRIVLDRMTELALGDVLEGYFVESNTVLVSLPIPRGNLEHGMGLVAAHADMVDALKDQNSLRVAASPRGIEIVSRGMAERYR